MHVLFYRGGGSGKFAAASVVPLRRSRLHGTVLRSFRHDCKRTPSTQFQPSWNHPSTHLTTCLPRLTLHLTFRACSRRVWPICSFAQILQEDKCRSACRHRRTNALLTHPTLPYQSVHPCDFHRRVPNTRRQRSANCSKKRIMQKPLKTQQQTMGK